jgi:hypothetical protein
VPPDAGGPPNSAALRKFKFNEKADRRLVRRVLSEEEVATLLRSTQTAPDWRGMSGPDRALFYKLAVLTGYRRYELGALQPTDFVLDAPAPVVRLGGEHTKNGDDAGQPIPTALAAELRPWLAGKPTNRPVFDPLPEKTGLMLKADLRRAGIDPGDALSAVDMHSLRHGYVTLLIRSGANLSTVQKLARHSTPDLTSHTYAHLSLHDAAAAVERLPALGPTPPDSEAGSLAATGTDGPAAHISNVWPFFYPLGDGGPGRVPPRAVVRNETTPGEGGCHNSLDPSALDGPCRDMAEPVANAPRRTRTFNPLIKSRAARRESTESNLLRESTLSRSGSRRWATSLGVFYDGFSRFSSLSLTEL